MGLTKYKEKRNFGRTPEPSGDVKKQNGEHQFFIQKHAASHLHYDFRLEIEGVLKSWAVPKGPSLNPADKRLAMMVEDHPMEYGEFEGVIPKGNYGAGSVMLWDKGTFTAVDAKGRAANEKELKQMLYRGDLKIELHGEKIKGRFALVKTRSGKDDSKDNKWLLIKKKDDYASESDVREEEFSVKTGRKLEEIAREAEDKQEVWHSPEKVNVDLSNTPEKPIPPNLKPMKATLVDDPFDSPDWVFEIKWDGYRALAEIEYNKVSLYSRNGLSFNEKYPDIVNSLKKVSQKAVLDGELTVLDEKGRPDFHLIQNYQRTGKGNLVFFVFDILYFDGHDLTGLPLIKRKDILKLALPQLPDIQYSEHYSEEGKIFFEQAERQQLEGIIAKRADSTYEPGSRSRSWLKIKTEKRQEVVIGGYTEPRGSRKKFGALVAGIFEDGKLKHAGEIGGGFNQKNLEAVYEKLKPLERKTSPFKPVPKPKMPVHWVKPELVAEVKFSEWTQEGKLRHPVFIDLRIDKEPKNVIRETEQPTEAVTQAAGGPKPKSRAPKKKRPSLYSKKKEPGLISNAKLTDDGKSAEVDIEGISFTVSNIEKVYWPELGLRKKDLVDYYYRIADWIMPYMMDRPQSLRRNPNGIDKKSFFQKNQPKTIPEWIETEKIWSDSNKDQINYMLCNNKATLVYMANLGCVEMNPWFSRAGTLDKPDYCVIDLDPQEIPFEKVAEAALATKEVLDKAGIEGYCKTSGSRGLHIYIPLGAKYNYEQCKQFGEIIAQYVHRLIPDFTSLLRSPAKRVGKIYLDFLQNRKGQTLAAPYCLRPKPGATVSTPLKWEEVNENLDPKEFNIFTIFERLEKTGDLFKPVLKKEGINMGKALENLQS